MWYGGRDLLAEVDFLPQGQQKGRRFGIGRSVLIGFVACDRSGWLRPPLDCRQSVRLYSFRRMLVAIMKLGGTDMGGGRPRGYVAGRMAIRMEGAWAAICEGGRVGNCGACKIIDGRARAGMVGAFR